MNTENLREIFDSQSYKKGRQSLRRKDNEKRKKQKEKTMKKEKNQKDDYFCKNKTLILIYIENLKVFHYLY